jgi:hypothetical protein
MQSAHPHAAGRQTLGPAAFVVGLAAWPAAVIPLANAVVAVAAVVLGLAALRGNPPGVHGHGRWMAIAGLCCGVVTTGLQIWVQLLLPH